MQWGAISSYGQDVLSAYQEAELCLTTARRIAGFIATIAWHS
jgi:hypothetical protein